MAQYAASAAQHSHSQSPISPNLASVSSATGGSVPPPTSTGPGSGGAGAGSQAAGQAQHKRVYQACIPCRRRKVRCDLGSVDNPHDPPCVRCRRESKECYFSATRRKRKLDDGSLESIEDMENDDYTQRNGRKQIRTSTSPARSSIDHRMYSEVPLTPGGSRGRTQPLRRPGDPPEGATSDRGGGEFGMGEPNTPLENFEAKTVMRREVYGPQDALDLLYKAATEKSVDFDFLPVPFTRPGASAEGLSSSLHKHNAVLTPAGRSAQSKAGHPRPHAEPQKPSHNRDRPPAYHNRQPSRQDGTADQPIDPALTKRDPSSEPGYHGALKAWSRFRFVRAGWFTPQEAMDYIEYYYDYLSPLTPISPPTFRNPASHLTLLTEEPILAVTLLTIASRYRTMPGTGGHCRSHAIHEQLWTYLRGMIERVVWGQEAFGGGFCGSGGMDESESSSTAPWRGLRRGSLRTFGTIESLMILTEWHPRALHFPPDEAIDELLLPSYDPINLDGDNNQRANAGFGGKRIESWLEPAWRSDRMCWMLLSTALGLGYELGVFDDIDELLETGAITRPEYEEETYRLRAFRIKRLLLVYLSQLAGRLGWTNMVPENLRKSDPVVSRKRPHSVEGTTPGTNPSSISNAFNYIPDLELDDQIIHCWAGISNAMHIGNEKLFRSRKHTTEIIQSGRYVTILKDFQPMLKEWWKEFERFPLPLYMRHILTIEYEYVRIYVNSLSLQAVVERCTSNAGGGSVPGGSVSGNSAPQLSPQTQNYYGKLPLGQLGGFGVEDQEYVKEVVNGSRNLLRTVVEGLLPHDYLKHAPVRTYFRIISGAMFLLKTFALGAPRSDVEISINLMDQTVDALRTCVVDDVHLGIRFADMLETLTSRLRNRFIHAPLPAVSTTDGRSPAHNQADGLGPNGHGLANQLSHGAEAWNKLRDVTAGAERSSTPANISATPWDLTTGNFPYPSGSASMFGPSTPANTTGQHDHNGNGNGNGNGAGNGTGNSNSHGMDSIFENDWTDPGTEMWYLPPGPAFYQNIGDNTNVSMTAEGVNIGGIDLLEYMAMDPMDQQFGHVMDGNGY